MTEIYLRDDKFANQRSALKLSTDHVKNILEDIGSDPPTFIKPVGKGFIIKFRYESDVNYIMNRHTYKQLQKRYLTPDLTKDTRYHRELLLSDIPDAIMDESTEDMAQDLEDQYDIRIINTVSYTPSNSTRNFVKIVLQTRTDKEKILSKGLVYLFHARIRVSNSCPQPPDRSLNQNIRPSTATPRQHGPSAPNTNAWHNNGLHGSNQQEHTSTPSDSSSSKNLDNHKIDPIVNFHINAFNVMSVSLSQGLENPDIYVYIFNKFLTHNGYPEINVPKDALIKKHNNSATQPSTTNTTPSTPATQTPIQPTHVSPPIPNSAPHIPPTSTTDPTIPNLLPNSTSALSLNTTPASTQTLPATPASTQTHHTTPASTQTLPATPVGTQTLPATPAGTLSLPPTPASSLSPPPPPTPATKIATLANPSTQTIALGALSSSVTNDHLQITSTITTPVLSTSLTLPLNSQPTETTQSFQVHVSPLPQLNSKSPLVACQQTLISSSNSLHGPLLSYTSPNHQSYPPRLSQSQPPLQSQSLPFRLLSPHGLISTISGAATSIASLIPFGLTPASNNNSVNHQRRPKLRKRNLVTYYNEDESSD